MVKTLFSLRKRGNYLNPYGSKIWNDCCDKFEKLLDQRIDKLEDEHEEIREKIAEVKLQENLSESTLNNLFTDLSYNTERRRELRQLKEGE